MARVSVLSDEVQSVVRQLVPILLETGGVAGVVRVLNSALDALGVPTRLHANRVSALLSDDVGRGVNDSTLDLVRQALGRIDKDAYPENALVDVRHRAQALREPAGSDLQELADQLSLPRAVVRMALFGESSHFALAQPSAPTAPSIVPDWSYQDVAVARVKDSFRRRPDGRIGLVLPTGAGKTRVALRIILETLADAPASARVIWVTHRKTLKRQAFRQLGKLLESKTPLPPDADVLANRVIFAMVSEVRQLLAGDFEPALIVVDEAHHAAAPSYGAMFEPRPPCPVLLLTATPNRPDALPIWVEEIAFTITYRELAERGTIVIPEFVPFEVRNFDWQPEPPEWPYEDRAVEDKLADLIDWLIDETSHRFRKVLLLAPRVERVEEFYARFIEQLQHEQGHPLSLDDIGYIHGGGNSLGLPDEDFLERFEDKPRAVLVSAQMLLEGFDDPAIDTVVLTYPTSSVIRLMQAAGRCVRQHPGKTKAYVVQANNTDLAYRFDQRWLYQELHDYLRPQIVDKNYGAPDERRGQIEALLDEHRVTTADRAMAMAQIDALAPGDEVRLFFYGKPYFGEPALFDVAASWGVFVETPESSAGFRELFNGFSAMGAQLSDPTDYLSKMAPMIGIPKDLTPGSAWRKLGMVLTASFCAREELYGTPSFGLQGNRPKPRHGPTSWLRYATFSFQPEIPAALAAFLNDCHNRPALEAAYLAGPDLFAAAVKVPLPLGGSEGLLVPPDIFSRLESRLRALTSALRIAAPGDRYAALAAHLAIGEPLPLPNQFAQRVETLLGDNQSADHILIL
jgi:superfamily II DNA or RNA helicase